MDVVALSAIHPTCLPVCVLFLVHELMTGNYMERTKSGLEKTGSTESCRLRAVFSLPGWVTLQVTLLPGSRVPPLYHRENNNTSGIVLW